MSVQTVSSASAVQQSVLCVQADNEKSPTTSAADFSTRSFSAVSVPLSHPLFSVGALEVFLPFNTRSGGIPLRTLPLRTVTWIAHALGDDLHAEQLEVICQFKLFAQGIRPTTISEMAMLDILTLGGTAEAPRTTTGEYTREEHYLGWKQEHFKKFFDEYIHTSLIRAGRWQDLQMPRWVSKTDMISLSGVPVSKLDLNLQESISVGKKHSNEAKRKPSARRNTTKKARGGKYSHAVGSQSRPAINRRGRGSGKSVPNFSVVKNTGPATRPKNVYGKTTRYDDVTARNDRNDRDRYERKPSTLPLPNTTQTIHDTTVKPPTSLRDTEGLGPAISKTVKPFHSITVRFQEKKVSEKAALPQTFRDFVAQKTEEMLKNSAQKDAVLHLIRTAAPGVFYKRRDSGLIDYHSLSDDVHLDLARLISDASGLASTTTSNKNDPSSSMIIDVPPAPGLTNEMVLFTNENLLKLSEDRQHELGHIMERTIPSINALPAWQTRALEPEDLPVENQIMIWKYLKMHLPQETGVEMEGLGENEHGRGLGDMQGDQQGGGAGAEAQAAGRDGESTRVDQNDFDMELGSDHGTDIGFDMGIE